MFKMTISDALSRQARQAAMDQQTQDKQMSTREIFAGFLRGADNGTNAIHANRAAVLAHARRALVLAGPKGRLP